MAGALDSKSVLTRERLSPLTLPSDKEGGVGISDARGVRWASVCREKLWEGAGCSKLSKKVSPKLSDEVLCFL